MSPGDAAPGHGGGSKPLDVEIIMPDTGPANGQGRGCSASLEKAQQFPSTAELVRGFRRCWLRAVTLGILCAGAAAAVTWFTVPPGKSRARTLLLVMQDTPHDLIPLDNQQDYQTFKRVQIALVKSRLVLNAALKQGKVAELAVIQQQPDPVQWLEEHLTVDYSAGQEILTIGISGDQPEELIEIVNAVAKAYREEVVNKEYNLRQTLLDQLKTLQTKYEEKLKEKRNTLKTLAEAAGAGDVANLNLKQRIALEQLSATQRDLTQLKSEVRKFASEASLDPQREETEAEAQIRAQQRERLAFLEDMEKRLKEDVERLDKEARLAAKRYLGLKALREEIAPAEEVLKKVIEASVAKETILQLQRQVGVFDE